MKYEILYPGLFYFKEAIKEPQKVIDIIEAYDGPAMTTWDEWSNKNPTSDEQAKSTLDPYGYGRSLHGDLAEKEGGDIGFVVKSISEALNECSSVYIDLMGIDPSNERNIQKEFVIGKYLPGKARGPHIDCTYDDLEHSYIIYYNDDYVGGELIFPEIGISIKPEAGSIVLFKSMEKQFLHYTHTTTEDSTFKYISPHFWRMGPSQGYRKI